MFPPPVVSSSNRLPLLAYVTPFSISTRYVISAHTSYTRRNSIFPSLRIAPSDISPATSKQGSSLGGLAGHGEGGNYVNAHLVLLNARCQCSILGRLPWPLTSAIIRRLPNVHRTYTPLLKNAESSQIALPANFPGPSCCVLVSNQDPPGTKGPVHDVQHREGKEEEGRITDCWPS